MLRILVATDFTRSSEAAYRYCLMLAGNKPCHLIVAHVYRHLSSVNLSEDQVRAFVKNEQEVLMDKTRRFSRLYPDAVNHEIVGQCTIEVLIKEGPVSDTILDLAQEHETDVIVIGSKKHPGILKRMFGQISSTLIYSNVFPILVVPENSVEVGADRMGLLSLNPGDTDRLVAWRGRSSLTVEHAVVCHLFEGESKNYQYYQFHFKYLFTCNTLHRKNMLTLNLPSKSQHHYH